MSYIYINHLVLEAQSPIAIYTGDREAGFDNQILRDVNGLPYLAATSIAGVWRHLYQSVLPNGNNKQPNVWFGDQTGKSKLSISSGYLLDSRHKQVKGLWTKNDIDQDPLLSLLAQTRPLHRERVSLNDRGVANDKAKFDQILLPKGMRFCVTVQWQGEEEAELNEFQTLLNLLESDAFAIGTSTSNGLGQLSVVGNNANLIALANNPSAGQELAATRALTQPKANHKASATAPFAQLSLRATGTWRFGQGAHYLSNEAQLASADILTYSEQNITWQNQQASIGPSQPVLPGSAIKGVLAHRFAFHHRRLNQQWAEQLGEASHQEWSTRPDAANQLFGEANESDGTGRVGKLIFHDASIDDCPKVVRHHNRIDRFTGGVLKGALFSEELLEKPRFTIRISLRPKAEFNEQEKQALQATFDDLELGLLPLGASTGRGHSLTQREGNWTINWEASEPQQTSTQQEDFA
ncbi:RAMP superfamily CRISPR-associated protein [Vibrio chaetopteri]|uniref:RAMP superfamily CRISPR-associated protein n=1 Tax=Vibrio chaetopteri TaxID=3016528 RepID=UPI003AB1D0E8